MYTGRRTGVTHPEKPKPQSQIQIPGEAMSSEAAVALGMEAGYWRIQLQADCRETIVNKMMEALNKHIPVSGHEGLLELKKIAARFEEKIYSAAVNLSDYLRKISLKMLTIEGKSQVKFVPPRGSKNPLDPVSVPGSMFMQASSIKKFNGLNFSGWSEHILFHLSVMNIDLALLVDKPLALTDSSTNKQRSFYKVWERSNNLCLMFMRMTLANNVKSTIPEIDSAKEFMKFMKSVPQSEYLDESNAWMLLHMLATIKFDGSCAMCEHVNKITNIAVKLKSMGMQVDENFVVQSIIETLPIEYGSFQINYNNIKKNWNVTELQSMLIQEEAKLQEQGIINSVDVMGQLGAAKKPVKKNKMSNKGPLKINGLSAQIRKKEQRSGEKRVLP